MATAPTYAEFIKNCQSFNQRISAERKHRLPFLDAQTGIAQSPSHLWRDQTERRLSTDPYVAFSYAAPQRWRRRKSNFNIYTTDVRWATKTEPIDSSDPMAGGEGDMGNSNLSAGSAMGIAGTVKSGGTSGGGGGSEGQMNVSYTRSGGGDGGAGNSDSKVRSRFFRIWSRVMKDGCVFRHRKTRLGTMTCRIRKWTITKIHPMAMITKRRT